MIANLAFGLCICSLVVISILIGMSILLNDVDIPSSNPSSLSSILKNCSMYSAGFIDSSPNCSARTSQMRDDTDFRRGPGGSPNAARHYTRKGGA